MIQVNTIRAVVRAKFVKPAITVREQAKFAGASPSATYRLNKRCVKFKVDHPLLEQMNDSQVKEALRLESPRVHNKREPDYNY